ncbi:MAG: hypothetical protein MI974_27865 [Chitinophagales bacterium]|nr:hypothetical protein [Chitinophagales bacterium]
MSMFILILSCTKRELSNTIFVEPEIQPYLDDFVAEAAKRGYVVDFSDTGLIMEFGETPPGTSATCLGRGNAHEGLHHMIFDKEAWDSRTPDNNASRVYHELGHCELSRPHDNTRLVNNMWKTIMRGQPFASDEEGIARAFYGFRKPYYIDELFDADTPSPFWTTLQFEYDEIQQLQTETLTSFSAVSDTIFELLQTVEQFEFESIVSIENLNENLYFQWGTKENGAYLNIHGRDKTIVVGIIENGRTYRLHQKNHPDIDFTKKNKFTIREQSNFCKIFVNEEFEFLLDTLNTPLLSIGLDSDGGAAVSLFKVSKIL